MDDLIKIKGVGRRNGQRSSPKPGIVSFAALAQVECGSRTARINRPDTRAGPGMDCVRDWELAKALPQDNEGQSGTNTEGGTGAGSSATSAKPKATFEV